jgi:hypothetical protein
VVYKGGKVYDCGASTPPPIDWYFLFRQSKSLTNSFQTESENSPFSVVGTSLSEDYSDEIADLSVNFPEDEIKIPCKKERVSTDDYSMLSSEIVQVLRNFDTILKQVEGENDILLNITTVWVYITLSYTPNIAYLNSLF